MTKSNAAKKILDIPPTGFYVYTLMRPSGEIFYVGKGCGKRVDHHEREAKGKCNCHKCNVIRKIWRSGEQIEKEIIFITENEYEAYDYEKKTIAIIGLCHLTNVDPGGTSAPPPIEYCPGKKLLEITSAEHAAYLRAAWDLTPSEHAVEMENWQHRKLSHIEARLTRLNWRRARGYDVAKEMGDLEECMRLIYLELKNAKQVKTLI